MLTRNIVYRAKAIEKDGQESDWVFGCLVYNRTTDGEHFYIQSFGFDLSDYENKLVPHLVFREVYGDTIDAYTGLHDRNGNRIFGRDILYYKRIKIGRAHV